jgi:transcriptional regulator with XRE-family HTH domain
VCLTRAAKLSAREIRAGRENAGVSQAVFAEHIGVTTGLVSKWERGQKQPRRIAHKMLAIVKTRGLAQSPGQGLFFQPDIGEALCLIHHVLRGLARVVGAAAAASSGQGWRG